MSLSHVLSILNLPMGVEDMQCFIFFQISVYIVDLETSQ